MPPCGQAHRLPPGEAIQTCDATEANDWDQQTFARLVIKENLLQIGKDAITEGKNQLMSERVARTVSKARARCIW